MDRIDMLFPGGRAKAFTLSYDDGRVFDRHLVSLVERYGVKATFNLNSGKLGNDSYVTAEELKELYKSEYTEVATHGVEHAFMNTVPSSAVLREVVGDREALEKIMDCIVRGHAYPYGAFNDEVIELLKASGIAYARTVNSTHELRLPENWYRWNPSCHHDDPRLMELADRLLNSPVFYGAQLLYVWGHSYEFDGKNNWNVMENLLEKLGGRDDVWYATNIEIHDYTEAFRSLQWSADCMTVHNPTAYELWLSVSRKNTGLHIAPGETLKLQS